MLWSQGRPQIYHLPASASSTLGSQACATTLALLLSLGVDFLMVLKAGTETEAFPTDVTSVRLFSSVNSLVCLKT